MADDLVVFLQSLPGYPWLPCPICHGMEGCDHATPERARAAYLERDAQLAKTRVRRYGQRRAAGGDHTTACSIWGDDGQGNAKGFSGPLICNCGALENFYQAQLTVMTAERDALRERLIGVGIATSETAAVRRLTDLNRETSRIIDAVLGEPLTKPPQ